MEKCPNCEHRYSKYPIKDKYGKFIWINFFKMDPIHLMFLVSIIIIIFGFYGFQEKCEGAVNDPCGFCEKSNCCLKITQPEKTQDLNNYKNINDLEDNIYLPP